MKRLVAMGLVGVALGGCAAQSAEEGSRMHAFGATFIVHGIGAGIGAVACFAAAGEAGGGSRGDGLVGAGGGLLAGAALAELLGIVLLLQGDGGFERELERAPPLRIVERIDHDPAAPKVLRRRSEPEIAPVDTSTVPLEQLTPLQRWIREKEATKRRGR